MKFVLVYRFVAVMGSNNFARLADPEEHVIQLLQLHFFAVQTVMSPILASEQGDDWQEILEKFCAEPDSSIAKWADSALGSLPLYFGPYLAWLRHIRRRARTRSFYQELLESTVTEID